MFRFLLICAFACAPLPAQTAVTRFLKQKTLDRLHKIDTNLGGVLGVAALDLTNGHVLAYKGDAVFPTASSIKIAILMRMFGDEGAGRFRFNDTVTLTPADNAGASDGPLQAALDQGAVKLTILNLIEHMIQYSDNSATNKCIDIAGMDRINQLIGEAGLKSTHLRRKMMDLAAAARGDENVSTPLELSRLMQIIYENKETDMLAILKRVNADMRRAIPAEIEVAAKPGELDGVRCEVGLVFLPKRPFIVTVMSTYLDDGANPVGEATRVVFEYFQKLARSNDVGRRLP